RADDVVLRSRWAERLDRGDPRRVRFSPVRGRRAAHSPLLPRRSRPRGRRAVAPRVLDSAGPRAPRLARVVRRRPRVVDVMTSKTVPTTLEAYAEHWKKRTRRYLKPRARETYAQNLRLYLIPRL